MFEDIDNIETYLQRRMNEFFAPFSSDFRLSIMPASTGSELTRPSSGANGTQLGLFNRATWNAKLDVVEKDNAVDVTVDLPGVNKEDVQIHVDRDGKTLTVQAERKAQTKKDTDKFHYSERSYGMIKRTVSLPPNVDVDKVKSSLDNGILHLEFGKKPHAESMKKITLA